LASSFFIFSYSLAAKLKTPPGGGREGGREGGRGLELIAFFFQPSAFFLASSFFVFSYSLAAKLKPPPTEGREGRREGGKERIRPRLL